MKRLILPSLLAISATFSANAGYGYLAHECGYALFPNRSEYSTWWESELWTWEEYLIIEGRKLCPKGDVYYFEDLPDPEPPVVDDRRVIDPKKTESIQTDRAQTDNNSHKE